MLARRLPVLAAALAAAAFGLLALRGGDRCRAELRTVGAVAFGADRGRADELAGRVADRCRGGRPLAAAAMLLARRGDTGPAVALADEAIRREPRNHEGWAALAAALRAGGLEEAAARADREVRRLNPRFGARAAAQPG